MDARPKVGRPKFAAGSGASCAGTSGKCCTDGCELLLHRVPTFLMVDFLLDATFCSQYLPATVRLEDISRDVAFPRAEAPHLRMCITGHLKCTRDHITRSRTTEQKLPAMNEQDSVTWQL